MAASVKAIRNVRKLERPRPLKSTGSSEPESPIYNDVFFPPDASITSSGNNSCEDVLRDLEFLSMAVTNGSYDENTHLTIIRLITPLKLLGQQLEMKYKDRMDLYFKTLRNASREEQLDLQLRARLLEIIELRANAWGTADVTTSYYSQKLSDSANATLMALMTSATLPANFIPGQPYISPTHALTHSTTQILTGGEVLKNSGKFSRPTKIPGKNYFKDEVVIRNSDSGKVMGIKGRRVHMIEEMSDTVISFQRVTPGTRDRLVQITGPSDECIDRAKLLIEDTIRRNASPMREAADLGLLRRTGSESSNSLNSTTSEESGRNNNSTTMHPNHITLSKSSSVVHNEDTGKNTVHRRPITKQPLIHSHSMSDASFGDYVYSVGVGLDTIRISSSKADLVKTAKLVLEEYFAGQAKLADMQSHRDMALARLNTAITSCSLKNPPNNSNSCTTTPFIPMPFVTSNNVRALQKTFSSSQVSDMSSSNGNGHQPLTSSSEDDNTLKENSPGTTDDDVKTNNTKVLSSPAGYSLLRGRKSSYESKQRICYTKDFLLSCGQHPFCKTEPKNVFTKISEIAPLIIKRVWDYCDLWH